MLARGTGGVNVRRPGPAAEERLARSVGFDYHRAVSCECPPVSSQRVRENRILEKLRLGTLPPAAQLSTPEAVRAAIGAKPSGEGRCRGCDELQADSLVADHSWHYLCFLFWQGRHEIIRQTHRADPKSNEGDQGIAPQRARWVVVVKKDRPDTFAALRRNFAGSAWVEVVVDRRRGDRRRAALGTPVERRRGGRRTVDRDSAQVPTFRRAQRSDDCEVYEATTPLPGRCPQCGAGLSVELPRFAEPPDRLELSVVHESVPPDRVRHAVELQSLSPTGRVLMATRLFART
jgi:hypothetical protein